jgi:inner membrane protein
MDNLSHSLAGLAGGELIHRCLGPENSQELTRLRRRLLLLTCWLSSNFPDLDLVLTPLLPAPLGYLLHHRGHTHTFLYAIPQGIGIYLLILALWPSARHLMRNSRHAHMGVALSIVGGLIMHLAMDYLNSYGIHPFHPFDSRWFYGDAVFILEPVFWVAFGVPLIMGLQNPWLKRMLLALLTSVLFYFTNKDYLLWPSLIFLVLMGMALIGIGKKNGPHGIAALLIGIMAGISFILVQSIASNQAKNALEKQVKLGNPAHVMLDAALTPFPSNPFCWSFISVESNETAGTYSLRRGWLSLSSQILPVGFCPASLMTAEKTMNQPVSNFLFAEHYQGNLNVLRQLKKSNCHIEAWLRFARAPVIAQSEAADMRFSSSLRGNFTALRFDDFIAQACPEHVPAWDFPRRDLLEGR